MSTPLAERPGRDRFTRSYTVTYRGHRLTIRKGREWGTFHVLINGQTIGHPYGLYNEQAARELATLQNIVDDAINRPDAYDFTPDRDR